MKKGKYIRCIILSGILTYVLILLLMIFSLGIEPVGSFENPDNYETISGVVDRVQRYDGGMWMTLRDVPADSGYLYWTSESFRMSESVYALVPPELLDGIKPGDTVVIDSQPGIFGDGWQYPITGLTVNGTEVLDPTEGRAAFVEEMKDTNRVTVPVVILLALAFIGNILLCVFSVRGLARAVRCNRSLCAQQTREPQTPETEGV